MPLQHQELSTILVTVVAIAKEAGCVVRKAYDAGKSAATKAGNPTDLVTETDQAVEKLIFSRLREAYPTHGFIGEESVAAGMKAQLTGKPTWIVDPIDGTTNFVHGFPFVAISIGLVDEEVPVLGVVYNPILDEMYTGVMGQGSFLNGARLPLREATPVPSLKEALLVTEFGSDRTDTPLGVKIDAMRRLTAAQEGAAHGMRATGSAALNLGMVARGSCDAYWECGIHVWDVAAGIVLLREAGGEVFEGAGLEGVGVGARTRPFDLMGRKVLAIRGGSDSKGETALHAQERLAEEILPLLRDYTIERD